jgi:hypothetical protein
MSNCLSEGAAAAEMEARAASSSRAPTNTPYSQEGGTDTQQQGKQQEGYEPQYSEQFYLYSFKVSHIRIILAGPCSASCCAFSLT